MIGKRGKFWGSSEKQSVLELRWRQVADCSRGGFQPPETWSPTVNSRVHRITSCEEDDDRRQCAGSGRKDTVVTDHAGIGEWAQPAWNQSFQRPQPMKVSQHQCDVIIPRRSMYQSGSAVEHRLKSTELGHGKSCECCIAVVVSRTQSQDCINCYKSLWSIMYNLTQRKRQT